MKEEILEKAEVQEVLTLKRIQDLLKESFFIPSYQRGYRWTKLQVENLLDDIWDFKVKELDDKRETFYCLQPVVVKKRLDSSWEVIDGQQRLTTIFIILHHINREFVKPRSIFKIDYETREDCVGFFEDVENEEKAKSNIDFFHINKAYKTINQWFISKEKQNDSIRHDFRSKLLNDVKVIWYDAEMNSIIDDDDDIASIDIFTRLNIGKIPLTNAELIKALFLQKSNFEDSKATLMQLQIAAEWDMIEKKLQDKPFWYFIYNPDTGIKYENRIEYIFDLMKDKKKEYEDLYTFHEFNNDFEDSRLKNSGKPNIENLWLKVKKYFLTFEEWYNSKELYHLIGYLVTFKEDINQLKKESESKTKKEFKIFLINKIKEKVNCQINELVYRGAKITEVLLLFNIETILATKNTDIRFPFYRYKDERWDIEHIRSQTDKTIPTTKRKEWAIDILEYFTGNKNIDTDEDIIQQEELIEKLDKESSKIRISQKEMASKALNFILEEDFSDISFKDIYGEVAAYFKEDKEFENKDSIGNLALLDYRTNRSYGNAMFPIKRRRIIKNDMNGVFVPICTKNVFLKFYSNQLGDVMNWSENDAEDYQNSIIKVLEDYLPNQNIEELEIEANNTLEEYSVNQEN